ncbi:uncharacterized protein DS421_18g622440 [Arachis hypogaea]|nr:uncharacterized protein DS421_18g622440 [Arachis hypogaea]
MIKQRKKERGSQIDGGTTTENAFLGYLAIMLCCKTEVAYREVAYSEYVVAPVRQRLLTVSLLGIYRLISAALQDKGCLQWIPCKTKVACSVYCQQESLIQIEVAGGLVDDLPPFDDDPPYLSFEDLERTFPRFSSLEGLGEYRVLAILGASLGTS